MALAHPALQATPSATREARILATVAHAAGVFGVAPAAAMYLLLRDHDERTAEQARLALNWQLTLGVLLVMTAVFDNVMIGIGLVDYNPDLISGAFVGIAPLEDFAYAIAAVVLLPALWHLLPARTARTPEKTGPHDA